jgi:Transposase DDE domain
MSMSSSRALGHAFAAVEGGLDGGAADEPEQAADHPGGLLMQVGVEAGQGVGDVPVQAQARLQRGDLLPAGALQQTLLGVRLEVVRRSDDTKGFQVLPRRWVVERSLGWLTRCRRLCRDYERTIAHAEDFIKVAMIRLMAARLTGQQTRYPGIRATAA